MTIVSPKNLARNGIPVNRVCVTPLDRDIPVVYTSEFPRDTLYSLQSQNCEHLRTRIVARVSLFMHVPGLLWRLFRPYSYWYK